MDLTESSFILIFLMVFAGGDAKRQEAFGPFIIIPKELFKCEGVDSTEQLVIEHQRLTKVNRTSYVWSGRAIFRVPISSNLSVHTDVAQFGNGGWRANSGSYDWDDVCESIYKLLPTAIDIWLEKINISSCPIPAGIYDVKDYPMNSINFDNTVVPYFRYGLYKIRTLFLDPDNVVLGCQGVIAEVIPKMVKKG